MNSDVYSIIFYYLNQSDLLTCSLSSKFIFHLAEKYFKLLSKTDIVTIFDSNHIINIKCLILIQKLINWNMGLNLASRAGHLSLVKMMIELGANDINMGFYCACLGGHYDIIKYLSNYSTVNLFWGLCAAEQSNNFELARKIYCMGAKYEFNDESLKC